uniref:Uncharacterized protein n=1 Tax=Picea glauca TaxID=3330 RepID=A0A101M2K6_PICGL|nr:hypothetical protein ABT39_MTgene2979 [Picea glauca]
MRTYKFDHKISNGVRDRLGTMMFFTLLAMMLYTTML